MHFLELDSVTRVWERYSLDTSLHFRTECRVGKPTGLVSCADDVENQPAVQSQMPQQFHPEMLHKNACMGEIASNIINNEAF